MFPHWGTEMRIETLLRSLLALLLLAASGLPAFAASQADVNARIDQVLGNHARYETTIEAFQQSVIAGNREDVAAFVRFPIVVTIGGHKRSINSAKAFVAGYDEIMTPDIVAAVKSQKYEDLFVNSQGIMFGNGEVWIGGMCLDRKCRTFVPQVTTIQHAN